MSDLYSDEDKVLYDDFRHVLEIGKKVITVSDDKMDDIKEYSYNYLNVIVERSETIYKIITDKANKDIFSGEILFRSLLEAYINFYDVIFNTEDNDLIKLKILRAKAIGAYESFVMFSYIGEVNPEGKKLLGLLYNQLKKEIIKSKAYQSLDEDKKSFYSDIENWYKKKYKTNIFELAKNSGISENNANLFYQYSSNYTHCDPFTIDQADIFIKHGKPDFFVTTILVQTVAVLAKSIGLYSKIISNTDIKDENFSKISRWYWAKMNKDIKDQ